MELFKTKISSAYCRLKLILHFSLVTFTTQHIKVVSSFVSFIRIIRSFIRLIRSLIRLIKKNEVISYLNLKRFIGICLKNQVEKGGGRV